MEGCRDTSLEGMSGAKLVGEIGILRGNVLQEVKGNVIRNCRLVIYDHGLSVI